MLVAQLGDSTESAAEPPRRGTPSFYTPRLLDSSSLPAPSTTVSTLFRLRLTPAGVRKPAAHHPGTVVSACACSVSRSRSGARGKAKACAPRREHKGLHKRWRTHNHGSGTHVVDSPVGSLDEGARLSGRELCIDRFWTSHGHGTPAAAATELVHLGEFGERWRAVHILSRGKQINVDPSRVVSLWSAEGNIGSCVAVHDSQGDAARLSLWCDRP